MNIVLGSRGSKLALWQANFVQTKLEDLGHVVELKIIKTKGDKIQNLSFEKLEGKGFFTKEIEEALLNKSIDLAVHSHKDLETTQPKGLRIGAVSYREAPEDVILIKPESYKADNPLFLEKGAIVGTSSARRQSLVRNLQSDLVLKDLRGNVPTRVQKLRDQDYDGIILAAAGIERLKLDVSDLIIKKLKTNCFVPAPAQGVLAFQIRDNEEELQVVIDKMNHADVGEAIHIEREILRQMDGGCQLPLGAFCTLKNNKWSLFVSYATSKSGSADIFEFTDISSHELINKALKRLQND